jgi:hypothetical protein
MKIYAVASTNKSWQQGGYGASLLAAEHSDLLVSFVEFMESPNQALAVPERDSPYVPTLKEEP